MGMTSDEATTFAAHLLQNREWLRKPRASQRVDRGQTKRPDARPPLRFRLEAAQALRRLAGWVGRVENVMLTSGRRPDDQGIRPYDHAMFYFRCQQGRRGDFASEKRNSC